MHNNSQDFVLRSVARSNGATDTRSEAIASISQDGRVVADVRSYEGDLVLSKASVNETSSTKVINARIISSKKVMAMATIYRNGVREVVAKEVGDDEEDKENQGFPMLSLRKRSTTSENILKGKEIQSSSPAVDMNQLIGNLQSTLFGTPRSAPSHQNL